jgi:hypothetical protein
MKVDPKDRNLIDKIEEALWEDLDEGSFAWGIDAGGLVERLAVLALGAVKKHQALDYLAELDSAEIMGDNQ